MAQTKKYPGSIEKRGSSFRVILYSGGERHTFTLNGGTRKEAEQYARNEHARLEKRRERVASGLAGEMSFSTLLAKYQDDRLPSLAPGTQTSYKRCAESARLYFVKQMEDPAVSEIRRPHIVDYLSWRRRNRSNGEEPLSNRTIQKDRAFLHLLFEYAEELELREGNPVSSVKSPKVETRDPILLNDAQFEALLGESKVDPMLYLYVLALGDSGARCDSEVLQLRLEDVDLEGGFLWIRSGRDGHRTKSGKGRWVPMTPRLREAFRRHFEAFRLATYGGVQSPYVFHHTRARRHAKPGARIRTLRRAFRGAAKRAKLPEELHQHDLRHRRVTTWLGGGASPVHVKEAMGHADIRTTMGYLHLAREHLRGLVDELDRDELRKGLNESSR